MEGVGYFQLDTFRIKPAVVGFSNLTKPNVKNVMLHFPDCLESHMTLIHCELYNFVSYFCWCFYYILLFYVFPLTYLQ